MNLTNAEFNTKLKKMMMDVKIIEKTHPREAPKRWLEICTLIVQFAKSPNCPVPLRKKLAIQAETILQKTKQMQQGTISSLFNADQESKPQNLIPLTSKSESSPSNNTSIPFQVSTIPTHSEDQEEDMLSELMALPQIPMHDEIEENGIPKDSSEITPNTSNQENYLFGNNNTTTPESPHRSLDELDAELKQMPTNMTEVSPSNFTSTLFSKINSNVDLSDYKKETQTLDVTSNNQPQVPFSNNTPPDSGLFKPSAITGDSPKIKTAPQGPDPFGPDSVPDEENETSNKACFACGATIPSGTNICPQCRTDNS